VEGFSKTVFWELKVLNKNIRCEIKQNLVAFKSERKTTHNNFFYKMLLLEGSPESTLAHSTTRWCIYFDCPLRTSL
jgi:hypothetical protein